ncbi:MAG: hypothetical protein F6K28_02915 [Microcoleus sp. SIO2G3]|nr:hypothetical protein [Microcoleus sp. SIO2G3]
MNRHHYWQLSRAIKLRRKVNLVTQRTNIAFVQMIVISFLHLPGQPELESRNDDADSSYDCDEDAGGDPERSPSFKR